MKRRSTILCTIISLFMIMGCTSSTSETGKTTTAAETTKVEPNYFDYGKTVEQTYQNTFFDFRIGIPADWHPLSEKQRRNDLGRANKEAADKVEAASITSANLLTVFKEKLGTTKEYNPNCIMIADNLAKLPNINTAEQYLSHTKKLIENSKVPIKSADEEIETVEVGGVDFHLMKMSIQNKETEIFQHYYVTIKKGFALCAVISYVNDEQKEVLEKLVDSLHFQ